MKASGTALWSRAWVVWLLIAAVETLHGVLRGLFVVPVIGEVTALRIGAEFDPSQDGPMVIELALMGLAPMLGARLRRGAAAEPATATHHAYTCQKQVFH